MVRAMEEKILLGPQDRVFVLTGAGISAESGLPTFRGQDGLWSGHRVEDVATPEAWESDPELVWRFYSQRRKDALASAPNMAHRALAELETALGDDFFLCTQNVDDLHERAGSRRLVHMHGELFRSRCSANCGAPIVEDRDLYPTLQDVPRCRCGARLRPHIVWFGEMPLEMGRIEREVLRCSVLLVVGTSGTVYPAASFVQWARSRPSPPARTYYVGPESPLNAPLFTRLFLGKAGETLPGLFHLERAHTPEQ